MFKIGCHLSSAGGYLAIGQTAKSIGANVFQFFTRNPRGGAAKPIDPQDVAAFNAFAAENSIGPILAHAPYTLNAAAAVESIRAFAHATMKDDLQRLEATPGALYNFHPGSHVGQGTEKGIELITGLLNDILSPAQSTTVLLETMAGKGSEVGGSFEELAQIISRTEVDAKLGVCLDTCHIWDGGYDIASNLDKVLEDFDDIIGLKRLKAIHLNDSMNPLAAHKDRHAQIGKGKIGLDALAAVVNHPLLRTLPFYLETPCDLDGYRAEIALLKSVRN
ncbi:MAG: deoxyribonuclease IV [Kiritimatiellae bacterium]|nr:deoxyribonuclease IV [Kiritimatiellia bacterium]